MSIAIAILLYCHITLYYIMLHYTDQESKDQVLAALLPRVNYAHCFPIALVCQTVAFTIAVLMYTNVPHTHKHSTSAVRPKHCPKK